MRGHGSPLVVCNYSITLYMSIFYNFISCLFYCCLGKWSLQQKAQKFTKITILNPYRVYFSFQSFLLSSITCLTQFIIRKEPATPDGIASCEKCYMGRGYPGKVTAQGMGHFTRRSITVT